MMRLRFAPSPTGNVHVGNIRAAIFNWLLARHNGGKFLLRVEDTDRERSTPEAIQTLLECMAWLGLDFDEPAVYQSKQTERHLAVARDLEARGFAYRDAKDGGRESSRAGECVVFRMPKEGELSYRDIVKGLIKKKAADTQDFVIVRSDGTPVFHLANVVDDIDMRVTHVIRGDDHVENTFRHIELFKAIGAPPPEYGHLPMIVNAQGKPYSKRDGAAFVGEFREQGYLPEALFNFLLLLGWNPGDEREVMDRAEMIDLFTLDKCSSSASRFDLKKLKWMNGEHIARQARDAFKREFTARLAAAGLSAEPLSGDFDSVQDLIQPRTKLYSDIPGNCAYFFTDDFPFDEAAVVKRLRQPGAKELLADMAERFESLPAWDHVSVENAVRAKADEVGGMGAVVHPVRIAVSGIGEGPGLFEMLALIGKERVCARLRAGINK